MGILITGAAGFIGARLSEHLLKLGENIVGIDNLNDYYDVQLKKDRLANLKKHSGFIFDKIDIIDKTSLKRLFSQHQFTTVINLAAQAGVRYSLQNPQAYIDSNIVGFFNILENCREFNISHLVFASSSSVYGANKQYQYSEDAITDHPISLYAATKKANESIAHSYANLYNLPCTGLRFFTVYGPWGRPDMSPFKFTKKIMANEAIDVYNNGNMHRDFTYIDDIVDGISKVIPHPPKPTPMEDWLKTDATPSKSHAPYRLYNIGSNNPISLMEFIEILENKLNKKAIKKLLPLQPGDMLRTYADTTSLREEFNFKPKTQIQDGIQKFVKWYLEYYNYT